MILNPNLFGIIKNILHLIEELILMVKLYGVMLKDPSYFITQMRHD